MPGNAFTMRRRGGRRVGPERNVFEDASDAHVAVCQLASLTCADAPRFLSLVAMNRGGQPGVFSFSKNSLRATPGSRRETTSVSSNSIYTFWKSSMLFAKIILAVFSNG